MEQGILSIAMDDTTMHDVVLPHPLVKGASTIISRLNSNTALARHGGTMTSHHTVHVLYSKWSQRSIGYGS